MAPKAPEILDPDEIHEMLDAGNWRKSMVGGGEHEYVVFQKQPEVYRYFYAIIKKHGRWEPFFKTKFCYWYFEDYRYWLDGNILNRAQLKNIPSGSGYLPVGTVKNG